jgi:hypothetical protein
MVGAAVAVATASPAVLAHWQALLPQPVTVEVLTFIKFTL